MRRFNYLDESLPTLIDRLRGFRVARHLQAPLSALATVASVVAAWWGIEQYLLSEAAAEVRHAQARLVETRREAVMARVECKHVEEIQALDVRLRNIRRSGAELSAELADLANRLPEHAWLVTLSHLDSTIALSGKATDLNTLSQAVKSLSATEHVVNAGLVRASREDRRAGVLISFELRGEAARR